MKANQINTIRAKLRGGKLIPLVQAIELRTELGLLAQQSYEPKNKPANILAFIAKYGNGLMLKRTNPQDFQVPYVWQLFTPYSSWVAGDTPAECFDKAIATKKEWANLNNTDVAALILAHQALKDARQEDTVQVAEVQEA